MAKSRQTQCPQGHVYSAENTYYRENGRVHSCKICNVTRAKLRYRKDEEHRKYKLQNSKNYRDRKRLEATMSEDA